MTARLNELSALLNKRYNVSVVTWDTGEDPYATISYGSQRGDSCEFVHVYVWMTAAGEMVTSHHYRGRTIRGKVVRPKACPDIRALRSLLAEKVRQAGERARAREERKDLEHTIMLDVEGRVAALARRHRFQYVTTASSVQTSLVVRLDDTNEAHIAIPHKHADDVLREVPGLVRSLRTMWQHRARVSVKFHPNVRDHRGKRRGARKWLGVA